MNLLVSKIFSQEKLLLLLERLVFFVNKGFYMKKFAIVFCCVLLLFACKTIDEKKVSMQEKGSVKSNALQFGKYYELVGIKNGDAFEVFEPRHGGGGLILFREDGKLSSTSGLNSGTGLYTLKEKSSGFYEFNIQNMGVTLMLGSNEKESFFDSLFFTLLQDTSFIKAEEKILSFYNAKKELVLQFYLK